MGILNVTPDSFSDGGRFSTVASAVAAGRAMFDAGAMIVDVGGESSRPGARPIDLAEERQRTLPVVRQLSRHGIVSIDTRKAALAQEAVACGASILNDTSGLLTPVAGRLGVGYVAMHSRGLPATMQDDPRYEDVVEEVWSALDLLASKAARCGATQIWVDPGIGFGKTTAHNVGLLRSLSRACMREWPVLVGVSRKSVVGALTGRHVPRDRVSGSLGAAAAAWAAGVDLIRTHDVADTNDLLTVLASVSTRPCLTSPQPV
ncbi:dihydropteroate synthase [Nocardia sp. CA2R105]|nr:dihydropteroate synthase [Nocardia coffeae]